MKVNTDCVTPGPAATESGDAEPAAADLHEADVVEYRVGELAEVTGVASHRLRNYEDRGLLSSSRASNGYRRFGADAPLEVARIVTLLHAGLNLDEVAQVLPRLHYDEPVARLDQYSRNVLRARSVLLEAQIVCLTTAKRALDRILYEDRGVDPLETDQLCTTRRVSSTSAVHSR